MEKIKLMVAEDHTIFRKALMEGLETDNIEVVGGAKNGKELIALVTEFIPDVVVLDLRMPEMDGHEVLKVFASEFKSIKTIVYSSEYTPYFVAHTILNGAAAYMTKNADLPELIKAVNNVYRDGFYFNELISKEILEQLKDDKKKLYFLIENQKFSEKELLVLKLLCDEATLPQIADQLNISQNTVLHHKKNLFQKTESNTIISLVKYAVRQGIISSNIQ